MECTLCPRMCGVDRTKRKGYCGADNKIKIARAALHYWEEPCISGEKGSGAVFFSNCTMKCVFCQNYEISAKHKGFETTVNELSDIILSLQDKGAENINFVTPTHYVYDIINALDIAKRDGLKIPVVYNTSGYERAETIKMLDGYVDIYLPDMKYYSDKYAVRYSNAKDYFKYASAATDEMVGQVGKPVFNEKGIMQKGVMVRHLLLPHRLFEAKKIIDYLYTKYHNDIYISIMSQYTPFGQISDFPELSEKIAPEYYAALVDYAEYIGVENAFIQNADSVGEEYIPDFYDKKEKL
ncbi:MAG: radical SAM protein [Oscillospiraceae bacterium]|nr:radical SAM protein [Oscillospiraceae bacterium]